jgi:hypothetical protein
MVSFTESALEEQRRAATFQLTIRDDRDTIAEDIGFIHVMCRQQDSSS